VSTRILKESIEQTLEGIHYMRKFHSLAVPVVLAASIALSPGIELRAEQAYGDDAQALTEAIDTAIRQGAYEDALRDAGKLLDRARQSAGDGSTEAAAAHELIGQIQRVLGRYDEAENAYRRSIAAYTSSRGADHPHTVRVVEALTDLYLSQNRTHDAVALTKQTLRAQEQALGDKHPDLQPTLSRLASLYRALGDAEAALRTYERLLNIQERALLPHHPDLLATINTLGQLHRERGEPERALPYYKRLLAHAVKTYGSLHPGLADAQLRLAVTYTEAGQYAQAAELYLEALKFHEGLRGDNPELAVVLKQMAAMYTKSGDQDRQREYERRLGELTAQAQTGVSD
jgi:tetratricopeptide (TPR) repeat protein